MAKEFIKQFKNNPAGLQKALGKLYQSALNQMLDAEMDDHLGRDRYERKEGNSNTRNGYRQKPVQSEVGELGIRVPRDRKGTFEPIVVPNGGSITEQLEETILRLYAKGMSVRDIEDEVRHIYGSKVSDSTVSRITGKIIESVKQWQKRPLSRLYFVVWLDGIRMRIKSHHKLITKTIYVAIGLNEQGHKEVLGLWVNDTESAAYWLEVLTDLRSRGVEDILISATDNLAGLTQAVEASFPKAITQICVVHQIRNSLLRVVWKEKKAFANDLKAVYTAPSVEQAEEALARLEANWADKYPHIIRSWKDNWANLTVFLNFPPEIRKMIYTTNVIEGLNRQIRKYTKNSTQYPSDDAALKAVFLAVRSVEQKWSMPARNWQKVLGQFIILFPDRLDHIRI